MGNLVMGVFLQDYFNKEESLMDYFWTVEQSEFQERRMLK
jgi:hypothetical protein